MIHTIHGTCDEVQKCESNPKHTTAHCKSVSSTIMCQLISRTARSRELSIPKSLSSTRPIKIRSGARLAQEGKDKRLEGSQMRLPYLTLLATSQTYIPGWNVQPLRLFGNLICTLHRQLPLLAQRLGKGKKIGN